MGKQGFCVAGCDSKLRVWAKPLAGGSLKHVETVKHLLQWAWWGILVFFWLFLCCFLMFFFFVFVIFFLGFCAVFCWFCVICLLFVVTVHGVLDKPDLQKMMAAEVSK